MSAEKLKEAELAYHRLNTGTLAVSITRDGRTIEFNRTNIHQLRAYIDELKASLGISNQRRRPPAGVYC